MLLSSFMQEFGPISSRVYCIFAQITNNKFVVELSIVLVQTSKFTWTDPIKAWFPYGHKLMVVKIFLNDNGQFIIVYTCM
jgi:hypothetical protein